MSGLTPQLKSIALQAATREEIELFLIPSYVDRVKELSNANGGEAGMNVIVGRGSYEIALLSTGGAIMDVDAEMEGEVEIVYVLTRPPAHHADAEEGMGSVSLITLQLQLNMLNENIIWNVF
ncbi:hypothetical protein [Pseudogracilibacillus sp. SO30301A]|uniref:hypothetical protein n=1 Tax=Pseudogracilibacillus sp. SO30301A TaxID=3098291 RepID=UPI00300E6C20